MLNDVYNAKILEYAGNIGCLEEIKNPDVSARAHSKLCGSTVDVSLKLNGDVVTDYGQQVKACALGQASCAIMAETIIGASVEELRVLRDTMYAMLKENGHAPEGRFQAFRFLEPVRDYKARHASTLLPFDAVINCIDQIEAAKKAA